MSTAIQAMPRLPLAYQYRHRVSFEDTNLVGNVYFVRFLSWQGRCRELFLLEKAPGILADLEGTLRLVTLNVGCDYFAELRALDEVELNMSLKEQRQHRIRLEFEYFVRRDAARILAARGTQEVACMRQTASGLVPTPVPAELASALQPFR
ncbi:MAG: acyl-CoA thioesterase [Xanthobacteraceae bacterium]